MFNMEMYYVDGFNHSVNEDSPLYVHTDAVITCIDYSALC